MEKGPIDEQGGTYCEAREFFRYLHRAAEQIVDPLNTGHAQFVDRKTRQGYFALMEALNNTDLPQCEACPVSIDTPPTEVNCPARADFMDNIQIGQVGFAFSKLRVKRTLGFLSLATTRADRLRFDERCV